MPRRGRVVGVVGGVVGGVAAVVAVELPRGQLRHGPPRAGAGPRVRVAQVDLHTPVLGGGQGRGRGVAGGQQPGREGRAVELVLEPGRGRQLAAGVGVR